MAKEDLIEMIAVVSEVLPDSRFRVTLETGQCSIVYLGAKVKKMRGRIYAGDRVVIEMPTCDLSIGRVIRTGV